jgi:hypothetical protein
MQTVDMDDAVNRAVPGRIKNVGFVAITSGGEALVSEPPGHPYGVSATLPKVSLQGTETPSDALSRCLQERVKVGVESVFPIPTVWVTAHGTSFFFAGLAARPQQAEPGQHWLPLAEAVSRLEKSAHNASRQRDLTVLQTAAGMDLCPHRRVLLMVRELHRMGFQQLRAPAYMYPLAWRCPVVPAAWTLREHGGVYEQPPDKVMNLLGLGSLRSTYSSAEGQGLFGWQDCVFATPAELARRFVRERPALALAGWGADPKYAAWLESALQLTAPCGMYYAFAEYQDETDRLYTANCAAESVPLPPPGLASRGQIHSGGSE